VGVLEVAVPAPRHRVGIGHDPRQALPPRPLGLGPDAVLEPGQALPADKPTSRLETGSRGTRSLPRAAGSRRDASCADADEGRSRPPIGGSPPARPRSLRDSGTAPRSRPRNAPSASRADSPRPPGARPAGADCQRRCRSIQS
jgi:hypothetical protein